MLSNLNNLLMEVWWRPRIQINTSNSEVKSLEMVLKRLWITLTTWCKKGTNYRHKHRIIKTITSITTKRWSLRKSFSTANPR